MRRMCERFCAKSAIADERVDTCKDVPHHPLHPAHGPDRNRSGRGALACDDALLRAALLVYPRIADTRDGGYLARWSTSGLPLRRWLANGLLLHARNTALAARRRAARHEPTEVSELDQTARLRPADHETDALLALERQWAVRVVTEAHEEVRSELHTEGRDAWWELFRLHTVHGKPYAEASQITGVPLTSASSVHRQVVDRLRARLIAILERDGARTEDLEVELAALQDLLER